MIKPSAVHLLFIHCRSMKMNIPCSFETWKSEKYALFFDVQTATYGLVFFHWKVFTSSGHQCYVSSGACQFYFLCPPSFLSSPLFLHALPCFTYSHLSVLLCFPACILPHACVYIRACNMLASSLSPVITATLIVSSTPL